MPAKDYVNASDMIKQAMDYEKIADEVESMDEITDNSYLSLEEFMKTWDAVEMKE